MKVLFITRKYPPQAGGMESYSYNLIKNYNGEKKVISLTKKQIHLLWFFPWCLIYIMTHARKYEILQLGDMLLSAIGWVAKKMNPSIKVVVTVHGLDITYRKKIYQKYLKMFSYNFDMYIPNSSYTNEITLKKGYLPTKVICPATLNVNRFNEIAINRKKFCDQYNIKFNSIILCTTGRLVKRKGVEWFIKQVLPRVESANVCYLVVGTGPMQDDIKKAIFNLGEKRVHLLGRVSDEELDNIYVHSDIFVMPNIYVEDDVEGYGMVAVEAAAANCIVIASKMQGIEDAVAYNESGILVEPENDIAFGEKIKMVINNMETHSKMAIECKKNVEKECSGKAVAEKYHDIFEHLLCK